MLLAGICLQLAGPQFVGAFINDAESHSPLSKLLWLAVAFLAAAVLSELATVAETFLAEDLGWRTTNALRADLTRHVLNLDAAFHAEHGPGELIERDRRRRGRDLGVLLPVRGAGAWECPVPHWSSGAAVHR